MNIMDKCVEEAAKAIYVRVHGKPYKSFYHLERDHKQSYLDQAKAALEAADAVLDAYSRKAFSVLAESKGA